MIDIDNISFRYPDAEIPVFFDFSLSINRSESWTIVGPSGCGKTTLLYLLAGLIQPNNGRILIEGKTLMRPRPQSGLILQDYGLLPWATVSQNFELGQKIRRLYGADGIHAPHATILSNSDDSWLHKLGLDELGDKYPSQLSGGQRQRIAIARTLNLSPDLLLMDEPFSSLDLPGREYLQELTNNLINEYGITLILVTHSIEESVYLGKKILVLKDPPNQKVEVIENPRAGDPNYRNADLYNKLCQNIRQEMEEN